jgi:excisionase family DNA binding protein
MMRMLRPSEVAAILGIRIQMVYKAVHEGILPSTKIGSALYIPRAAVLKLASCEAE